MLLALGVNLPAGHRSQVDCPSVGPKEPGRHGAGVVEPVAHAEPAGHAVQLSVCARPAWLEKLPPKHGSAAAARAGQKLPGVQDLQLSWPATSWYLPATQLTHDSAFAAGFTVPGAQSVGAAEPTGQNVPPGHAMQSSSELRKPSAARTVWLACVPPEHGCGLRAPGGHRRCGLLERSRNEGV